MFLLPGEFGSGLLVFILFLCLILFANYLLLVNFDSGEVHIVYCDDEEMSSKLFMLMMTE